MSAFNNNNSNLNNTSAGIEGRATNNIETAYQRSQGIQAADSKVGNNMNSIYDRDQSRQTDTNNLNETYSRPIDNTNAANNIETAYQGDQLAQSADYKEGNNLNDTYNRYQPGQAGAGELNENHGIAATGLNGSHGVTAAGVGSHNVTGSGLNANHGVTGTKSNYNSNNTHHTSELNENHGLAATGLNEPHTHSTVGRNNENLDFSGPQTDINKVNQQQENYGHTAGKDLNSQTNRTAGTGIPPVNTAEHVRRNRAEEEVDGNHTHSNQHASHHKSNTAALGDHGASHHDKNNGGVSQHDRTQADKERKAAGINEPLNNEADNKPSMGDKIKGNLEKVVGKISGNEEKVIKGENLAQGRSI